MPPKVRSQNTQIWGFQSTWISGKILDIMSRTYLSEVSFGRHSDRTFERARVQKSIIIEVRLLI